MAVYQTKSGGGLFGNIGSILASAVTGPIAPWIMAANAIYNGVKGDWGNALVSGLGAYNGFNPAAPAASGASSAASPGLSGNGGTGNVKLGAWNPQGAAGGSGGVPGVSANVKLGAFNPQGAAESIPQTWEHPNRYSLVWRR